MSDDAVLSCLDRRQTGSTVQLNPCISFLTTRDVFSFGPAGTKPAPVQISNAPAA